MEGVLGRDGEEKHYWFYVVPVGTCDLHSEMEDIVSRIGAAERQSDHVLTMQVEGGRSLRLDEDKRHEQLFCRRPSGGQLPASIRPPGSSHRVCARTSGSREGSG